MDTLSIAPTQATPKIELKASGEVNISGRSYPENTFEFYKPIMEWINSYLTSEHTTKNLTVNLDLIYFNSGSSKLLYELFDLLDKYKSSFAIAVNWLYDEKNEVALMAGEDYKEDFEELDIALVKK